MLEKLFIDYRSNRIVRKAHRELMKLHFAYENVDYDCNTNGERFVLERIAKVSKSSGTVFDVGANHGEWTQLGLSLFESGTFHSFEIISDTYQELTRHLRDDTVSNPKLYLNNLGLGECEETRVAYFLPERSGLATCVPGFTEQFHGTAPEVRTVSIVRGDQYCVDNCVDSITLMKVDVEGLEPQVIRGFDKMLKGNRIAAVQFEYGRVNIETRFLLKDFYDLFSSYGMIVGKVFPKFVNFKPYQYDDEDFLGPNYLAVRSDRNDIISELKYGRS